MNDINHMKNHVSLLLKRYRENIKLESNDSLLDGQLSPRQTLIAIHTTNKNLLLYNIYGEEGDSGTNIDSFIIKTVDNYFWTIENRENESPYSLLIAKTNDDQLIINKFLDEEFFPHQHIEMNRKEMYLSENEFKYLPLDPDNYSNKNEVGKSIIQYIIPLEVLKDKFSLLLQNNEISMFL